MLCFWFSNVGGRVRSSPHFLHGAAYDKHYCLVPNVLRLWDRSCPRARLDRLLVCFKSCPVVFLCWTMLLAVLFEAAYVPPRMRSSVCSGCEASRERSVCAHSHLWLCFLSPPQPQHQESDKTTVPLLRCMVWY